MIALMACLSSVVAFAAGKDDAAILKTHEDFAAAWNKHDPKAMAATFTEDADLINPKGDHAHGKAEVEALLTKEQTTAMKTSQFSSDCKEGIRMIKDTAVVTCSFEVTGAMGPDAKPMPNMKGIYTTVMTKVKGKWSVVIGRAMIPVQPPPAPAMAPPHKA
jgi:uncharacterized protein (TIGR02246 family)